MSSTSIVTPTGNPRPCLPALSSSTSPLHPRPRLQTQLSGPQAPSQQCSVMALRSAPSGNRAVAPSRTIAAAPKGSTVVLWSYPPAESAAIQSTLDPSAPIGAAARAAGNAPETLSAQKARGLAGRIPPSPPEFPCVAQTFPDACPCSKSSTKPTGTPRVKPSRETACPLFFWICCRGQTIP